MRDREAAEAAEGLRRGTLLRGVGSFYTVKDELGELHTLRCRKKIRRSHLTPVSGDEVLFSPGEGEENGWLEEILPRKTLCLRPPVANVTHLVIVLAPAPSPDLLLTDRLLSRAVAQGMHTAIAVNKTDLGKDLAEQIRVEYRDADTSVFSICAKNQTGLEPLKRWMSGGLCCLAGQSGAGKSTLLNALTGLERETGEISRKIARGRNTTRAAELIEENGIRVIDTAGFNLLESERELEPEKLRERYPEFLPYEGKCRFRECLHDREPGCAVSAAAEKGIISMERVLRYRKLLEETRIIWRERYD